MKKVITILILSLLTTSVGLAQVGVGTTNPDDSAALDVTATDKGFLPPRLTTAQRDAIASPAIGLVVFNTDADCLQWLTSNGWFDGCTGLMGQVLSIDCAGATNNGTLTAGEPASGVDSVIAYTNGNGGTYAGETVTSTGVTGLTATLVAGTFANGAGSVTYTITGTPNSGGTASFAISIGGQSCTLTRTVLPASPCAGVTAPPGYGIVVSSGKCWLDRNLGATQVATSSTDVDAYGDVYQWGRLADGHQLRTASITFTQSSSDTPGNANFIVGGGGGQDWRNPANDNLWQGVNGINNPCPAGFRLPTAQEFTDEINSWPTNQRNLAGAINSPLKMPAAGRRAATGGFSDVGSVGRYWTSSTISGNSAVNTLSFSNSFADFIPSAFVDAWNRANGQSVRCIKD